MSLPASPTTTAPGPALAARPKGLAVTALVLGIVSLALCWIPVLNIFFGIITGTIGAVFGVIGLVKSHRGMAIAGLVTALLGLIFAILVNTAFANVVAATQLDTAAPPVAPTTMGQVLQAPAPAPTPAAAPEQPTTPPQDLSMTYSVHASGATIGMISYLTQGFNVAQDHPGCHTWSKKVTYGPGGHLGWNMNAQLGGSGTISCTVTDHATGKQVTNTSNGQYVVVTCSAP